MSFAILLTATRRRRDGECLRTHAGMPHHMLLVASRRRRPASVPLAPVQPVGNFGGGWDGDVWDSVLWDGSSTSSVGRTVFASTGSRRGIDPGRSTGTTPTTEVIELASTGRRRGIDPGRSTGKGS